MPFETNKIGIVKGSIETTQPTEKPPVNVSDDKEEKKKWPTQL